MILSYIVCRLIELYVCEYIVAGRLPDLYRVLNIMNFESYTIIQFDYLTSIITKESLHYFVPPPNEDLLPAPLIQEDIRDAYNSEWGR